MGQKINPIGLRLGINRTWDSRWFAGKSEYGKLLHEDVKIREILHKELKQAAVARIKTETHRLARMQHTWFRADDARIAWLDAGAADLVEPAAMVVGT